MSTKYMMNYVKNFINIHFILIKKRLLIHVLPPSTLVYLVMQGKANPL